MSAQKADPEPKALIVFPEDEEDHTLPQPQSWILVGFSVAITRGIMVLFEETELDSEHMDIALSAFIDLLCVFGKVAFLLWALVITYEIKEVFG